MKHFAKPRAITTPLAKLTFLEPGIIEQRYLDNAQFSPEGLLQNLAAMETLCDHHGKCCLLSIFPAGMQVKADLMNNDHYRDQRNKGQIRALAVVTDSMEMHAASKLYFMYHQQPFETRVFEEEVDALRWLQSQLEEKGAA